MAKKQVSVSLRKPPPPADLERLVVDAIRIAPTRNGDDTPAPSSDVRELRPSPSARSETPPALADAFVGAPPSIAKSTGIPGVKSITVELPQDVADRLLAFCTLHRRDVNDVVAEIIVRHLAAQTANDPIGVEALVAWVRSKLKLVTQWRDRLMQLGSSLLEAI